MIHYTIKGEGKPLILIHGFPNDSSAWEAIVPQLAEQYRVLLPDLPGAGRSPAPEAPLTLEYMAETIREVMDHENIGEAVLAGHSMGGYTALQLAQRYPERVAGISLIHSLASADTEEKKVNRNKAIILIRKGEAEKEMFLKGMAQNLFAPEYAAAHPEMVKKIVANGMKLSAEALTGFYQAIMDRTDKKAMLPDLNFPLQWIIGDQDTATSMADALDQAHLAPVNQVSLYKPCGHMSFYEKTEELITDMKQFLHYCYP